MPVALPVAELEGSLEDGSPPVAMPLRELEDAFALFFMPGLTLLLVPSLLRAVAPLPMLLFELGLAVTAGLLDTVGELGVRTVVPLPIGVVASRAVALSTPLPPGAATEVAGCVLGVVMGLAAGIVSEF